MLLNAFFWGLLLLVLMGGCGLGWAWLRRRRAAALRASPATWNLNARPVFSADERALFNELRAALPHHVVLAKLNVLRFCQASDGLQARQWYERLQTLHVSFAICTPNGTVVAAVDVEPPRKAVSQRSQQLKEAVLQACRVRHVRCQPGQWPAQAALAAWALGPSASAAGQISLPTSPGALHDAGDQLARRLRERRAERAARWAESSFAQDSFFAFDSRLDSALHSEPAPLPAGGR